MKNLKQYIEEKLIVNKDYNIHKYHPMSWDELRQIIEERYKKQGPGTEQEPIDFNDIDVSGMTTFFDESSFKGIFAVMRYEYIDISDWDVSGVENMAFMFGGCEKLKSIGDLSDWNVSGVRSMSYMFYICENLKSVGNLNGWNILSLKRNYMNNMFEGSGITNTPDWYEE